MWAPASAIAHVAWEDVPYIAEIDENGLKRYHLRRISANALSFKFC